MTNNFTLENLGIFLEQLAQASENVYWLSTPDLKKIVYISPAYEKIWGRSREDLYQHPELWITYLHPDDLSGYNPLEKFSEQIVALGSKARYSAEYRIIRPDGETRWLIDRGFPIYDTNGACYGITGVAVDVTKEKLAEAELRKTKEAAEAASQAKTEFLENMRHDIRTPLTGIVGFAQIIREEAEDEKIKEYADNLATSGEALLEFLNEILDTVRLTSGELPINIRKFSLKERLKDIVHLSLPKARVKKLKFIFNYDESIPTYLIGDSKRVHRLVLELVANALNFTEQGEIILSAKIAKESDRDLVIKLEVADTGIGVPLERQHEIFTRFKRLTPSYQGKYKGAGLGLSVVKQFIDDLDGEIYLQSELNKGTLFTCLINFKKPLTSDDLGAEIPIQTPLKTPGVIIDSLQACAEELPNTTSTQILLVEDQLLAAKMARAILESLGCQVDHAENGKMALQKAAAKKYDLIFMDVGLPDLNGCEVTHFLRVAERNGDGHVPILGLTGHIDVENRQRCLSSGMDAVLSKPLAKNKALDLLNAFIPKRSIKKKLSPPLSAAEGKNEIINFAPLQGDVLDVKSAMQLLGGKKEFVIEMLEMLVTTFPGELAALNQAYITKNMFELRDLVHKMKGGACYCGTPRLKESCERLETYLYQHEQYDAAVAVLFEQLIQEISAVESAYKKLVESSK